MYECKQIHETTMNRYEEAGSRNRKARNEIETATYVKCKSGEPMLKLDLSNKILKILKKKLRINQSQLNARRIFECDWIIS